VASVNRQGTINSAVGYQVAAAAPLGHVLKGDGTRYVDGQVDLTELTGRAYGNMYADNVSITCTIAATDTYVQVPSGITGGIVSGFTFQTARELKCNVAGTYLVNWSLRWLF
jgi:hypothetical protein